MCAPLNEVRTLLLLLLCTVTVQDVGDHSTLQRSFSFLQVSHSYLLSSFQCVLKFKISLFFWFLFSLEHLLVGHKFTVLDVLIILLYSQISLASRFLLVCKKIVNYSLTYKRSGKFRLFLTRIPCFLRL